MTIATPSPRNKIRANSNGYVSIPTSIFNNFRQELEIDDNRYPLALKRAASSEAKLPSYIDNGCDDDIDIDIDIIDDTDTLSISSSDDSFVTGSFHNDDDDNDENNNNTQRHAVNSSFDSFIRTDDSDYDGVTNYNSDMSSQPRRLATVESGIALSDLDMTEKKTSSSSSSSKMGKSPSDMGCRSSMAFLPPLHPNPSGSDSHDVLCAEQQQQHRTHRTNNDSNNMSSSSYYSLDAGKHGFLTHHTPADSVDSLVFQYQDVPTSEGRGEEEEEEEDTNTPPIATGTSVEMNGWELSPRCILPYQERKRLMELEEDDHEGEHSRESSSSSSSGRFLELEEEAKKDGQDQQHPAEEVTESESGVSDEGKVVEGGGSTIKGVETSSMYGREESNAIDCGSPKEYETTTIATAEPGQAKTNTNNEGNNDQSPTTLPPTRTGLPSPKAGCFTRLFARATKKAKNSRGKISSRMRRFFGVRVG